MNSLFRDDELSDFILSQVQLGAVTKKLAQIKQTKIIAREKLDPGHELEVIQELKSLGYNDPLPEKTYRPGSMANIYFFSTDAKKYCLKKYHPDLDHKISKSINQLMVAGKFYAWKKNFELDSEKFSFQMKSVLLTALDGKTEAATTNAFRDAFPEIRIPHAMAHKNAVIFEYVDFIPAISSERFTPEEIHRLPGELMGFLLKSILSLGTFHADLNFENWGIDEYSRKLSILDFGEVISPPGSFIEFIKNLKSEQADLGSIGYTLTKGTLTHKRQLEMAQIIFAPFLASETFVISTWKPQERLKELLGDEYIKLRESSPSWILFYLRSVYFIVKFCEENQVERLKLPLWHSEFLKPPVTSTKRLYISVVKDGDEIVNVQFPATVALRLESVLDDELLERIKKTHDLSKIDESFSYEELNGNRKITVKFID